MNWYFQIKLAALWDTESDGDFDNELRRLYELEYKLSMLRSRPFNGMPKRQQNILARLEEEAQDAIYQVSDVLKSVFEKWLQGHALTNPEDWANAQMVFPEEEYGDDFGNWWDHFLAGIQNYTEHRPAMFGQQNTDCSDLFQMLCNLDNTGFEVFMNTWIYERKEMVREDKWSEWNAGYSDYETEDEMELAIQQEQDQYEQYTIGDYFRDFAGSDCGSVREALEQVSYYTGVAPLFNMLYSKHMFPKWFAHWQPQGIEETRERIEHAYSLLQNATATAETNITKALGDINIAIMTSHQTGGMVDHISEFPGAEDIQQTMDELTNMTTEDLEPWNKALRDVGVQLWA